MAEARDEATLVGRLTERITPPVTEARWVPFICNPNVELDGADIHRLREDLQAARGGGRFEEMERAIRWSELSHTRHLVTGHSGSGKSTELRRLKQELAQVKEGRAFHVVLVDIRDQLDLAGDIELPGLITAVVAALLDDELLDVPRTQTAKLLWGRLRGWAKALGPDVAADLVEGVRGLRVLLRGSPGYAQRFHDKGRNEVAQALTELGDLLREIQNHIVPKGYADLVVIIDSLEKIPLRMVDRDRKLTNYDLLFINDVPKLDRLPVHLILTFPIELHCSQTRMRLTFPNAVTVMVPMVRVRAMPSGPGGGDRRDDEAGHAALRHLLGRRIDLGRAFAGDDAIRAAIRSSGGCLRDLLRLVVRATYRRGSLPLELADIESVIREEVSNFERVLQGHGWLPQLHEVERTGAFPAGFDDNEKLRLIHDLIILEYDTGTWYDVHPFARGTRAYDLARPRTDPQPGEPR